MTCPACFRTDHTDHLEWLAIHDKQIVTEAGKCPTCGSNDPSCKWCPACHQGTHKKGIPSGEPECDDNFHKSIPTPTGEERESAKEPTEMWAKWTLPYGIASPLSWDAARILDAEIVKFSEAYASRRIAALQKENDELRMQVAQTEIERRIQMTSELIATYGELIANPEHFACIKSLSANMRSLEKLKSRLESNLEELLAELRKRMEEGNYPF